MYAIVIATFFVESCSIDGDMRLIGGQRNSEGRVEYCSGGVWGSVCDIFWDTVDASIVCNQLGYPSQGKCTSLHKKISKKKSS